MTIETLITGKLYTKYLNWQFLVGKLPDLEEKFKGFYEDEVNELSRKGALMWHCKASDIKEHLNSICKYAFEHGYEEFDTDILYCRVTGDFMYQFDETKEIWTLTKGDASRYWYGKPLYVDYRVKGV